MKKLSLGKLRLHSNEILERSELSTIYGGSGDDGCARFKCKCNPGTGTWYGTYCSLGEITNALQTWCENGTGNCTQDQD